MSDLLIKGLGSPKDGCHHTMSIYADGSVEIGSKNNYRVIEVPTHGRLIDADFLKEAFEQAALIKASKDKGNEQIYFDRIELVHGIIDRTPTILEASE